MSERAGRVAIFAPMPSELRPVVKLLGLRRDGEQGGLPVYTGSAAGTEVVATRTGIGPQLAQAAAERLLRSTTVDRVIVVGVAGGIEHVSAIGDLLVPAAVVDKSTGEIFRATPHGEVTTSGLIRTGDGSDYSLDDDEIARLREEGVTALDMETAAIARVCQQQGIPWLAFRAISDMAGDDSVGPVIMTLVNPDGSPRPWASIRFLLTHPRRIPRMVRLARDANAATVVAARAAARSARSPHDSAPPA